MRRSRLPGLDVAGRWVNPTRTEVEAWEIAYVLEVPEEEIRELFEAVIPVRVARNFLRDLARDDRLDGPEETALFADLISGKVQVDRDGNVSVAGNSSLAGRFINRRRQDMSLHGEPPRRTNWLEIEEERDRGVGS